MSTTRKPWDVAYNALTGCDPCSPGCEHCWAKALARRFPHLTGGDFAPGRFHARRLLEPLRAAPPADGHREVVFTVNLGDLFHAANDRYAVAAVWGVMLAADWHDFHVVTKRLEEAHAFFAWLASEAAACGRGAGVSPGAVCVWAATALADVHGLRLTQRMRAALERAERDAAASWPPRHVTVFATCENQSLADKRVPLLLRLPVGRRGVYAEPLLGGLSLNRYVCAECGHVFSPAESAKATRVDCPVCRHCDEHTGPPHTHWLGRSISANPDAAVGTPRIDQVITGGETGAGARGCERDWLHALRDECASAGADFTLKQYGPAPRTKSTRAAAGRGPCAPAESLARPRGRASVTRARAIALALAPACEGGAAAAAEAVR